jgi:hypothetical protein
MIRNALTYDLVRFMDMKFCPACGAAQDKNGLGAGKIALLVILAVAAIAVVAALVLGGKDGTTPAETTVPTTAPAASGEATETTPPMTVPADGNPDDATCKGSYTLAEGAAFNGDAVVATMGEHKLTNAELQVYYWMQVYDFLNQYGSYASMFGLDYTQPLDMQLSLEGTMTWQQYFLDSALDTWVNYQAMCNEANAAEYVLDEEYVIYLEELPENLESSALEMGYESAEDMIRRDMGPNASLEGYLNYLNNYYLGYMYYGDTLEQIPVTDAEVEAYYEAHIEDYKANGLEKTDERYVDVRHILITPEGGDAATEEQWAAAEKEANDLLNEWLTKHPDEDGFAVMAEAYTDDPGSASNGGLYEDVYVGQMVPEFENWCFDASRQTGDYGIVKTTYGYHIMYYVGSDHVWFLTAEQDMMTEKGNEFLAQVQEKYSAEIDYSAIQIGAVDLAAAG